MICCDVPGDCQLHTLFLALIPWKRNAAERERIPTMTKRPWCKLLSYETAENHSKADFGGEHKTTLGDLMFSRKWLHWLLCTLMMPALAWGMGVCVHTCDGADGTRAGWALLWCCPLLISVVINTFVWLSQSSCIVGPSVASRRQNRPFILKKREGAVKLCLKGH